ncbi:MAG TPA: MFS transporter [Acidisphaera sp.]|nr:MFS transporter [Acidisphaera sp.]
MPAWFLGYAVLGVAQSGMAPILLPLAGGYGGILYSAWAAAGLLGPILGHWSDQRGQHHNLAVAGLGLGMVSMVAFPFVAGLPAHLALAFTGGLGSVAATIMGTIFIVGSTPRDMWDERIGLLQTYMSMGQVAGLLLAGALAHRADIAFGVQAAAYALALPLVLRFAPRDPAQVARGDVKAHPSRGGEAGAAGGAMRIHIASWRGIASLGWLPHGPLALFLAVWLLSYTATNAVCVMFPVALTQEFHQPALLPAAAYAVGITLGLPLYRVAARWEHRGSASDALMRGLLTRALVLVVLAAIAWAKPDWATVPILAAFAATQILWPLLGVSSNTLAVELATIDRGESVGLLNACTALGATLGGVFGGQINAYFGFGALCIVACACVLGSVLLFRARPAAPELAPT